jgi:hypothetical protein
MTLPLRIDLHRATALKRRDRRIERSIIEVHEGRIILLPVHREPTQPFEHGPDQCVLEEGRLGQRARSTPGGMEDHQRIDQRVRVVRRHENGARLQPRPRSFNAVEDCHGPTDQPGDDPWQHYRPSGLR